LIGAGHWPVTRSDIVFETPLASPWHIMPKNYSAQIPMSTTLIKGRSVKIMIFSIRPIRKATFHLGVWPPQPTSGQVRFRKQFTDTKLKLPTAQKPVKRYDHGLKKGLGDGVIQSRNCSGAEF